LDLRVSGAVAPSATGSCDPGFSRASVHRLLGGDKDGMILHHAEVNPALEYHLIIDESRKDQRVAL
jgi:hypothetical protein